MKQTETTHEIRGHKYTILHTICREGHRIIVAKDGKLTPLLVWGKPKQYPQISVGGFHVCEILTTWDKLKPDNFLCWAN